MPFPQRTLINLHANSIYTFIYFPVSQFPIVALLRSNGLVKNEANVLYSQFPFNQAHNQQTKALLSSNYYFYCNICCSSAWMLWMRECDMSFDSMWRITRGSKSTNPQNEIRDANNILCHDTNYDYGITHKIRFQLKIKPLVVITINVQFKSIFASALLMQTATLIQIKSSSNSFNNFLMYTHNH